MREKEAMGIVALRMAATVEFLTHRLSVLSALKIDIYVITRTRKANKKRRMMA